jgi:zeaxanthin glucosyltransferase
MSHFGVLSYHGAGHLNPLIALSRRLIARGHHVTLFQQPALEQQILRQGLEFFPVEFPAYQSSGDASSARNVVPSYAAVRSRLDRISFEMKTFLRDYPAAIRATGVDTLLVGEISLTGPTVAEMLSLPYFVISTGIPHNFGWGDPLDLALSRSRFERRQSNLLEVSVLCMGGQVRRLLDIYRKPLGLPPLRSSATRFPPLAHITQWPECLDAARSALPESFFYTGPFVDVVARAEMGFPWSRLDSRPLVYASMGTTRKCDPSVFHRIAEACSRLGVQLVISLGGRRDITSLCDLPGAPIVVANAPQLELLQLADIVITHAGPNTALETLLHGKPMLALPLALDQPAVAAHLVRLGAAEALSTETRSAPEIHAALLRLLRESRYSEAARRLQNQLVCLNGLDRAADIIETRLSKPRFAASNASSSDVQLITT